MEYGNGNPLLLDILNKLSLVLSEMQMKLHGFCPALPQPNSSLQVTQNMFLGFSPGEYTSTASAERRVTPSIDSK